MSRNNPYIYIGLLIGLLLPSFLPAGPIGHVLVKGYEKTYRINRAPGVTEIVWQVFTDPLCTVPANPDAVELIYGTGENNQEVTVRWITEGTFYLMVSMMGESSCLNRKAWPFTIESPVQLQASAFCSDGLPWIRWDATIHGFSVDTISIDLFDVQGNRVLTIADAPLSGTMPWPGVTDKSNLVVPEALAILDLNARFDRIPGADPITIRLDAPDCSQPSVIAINDTVVAWHGIVNIFDILFNDFDSEGMLDSSSVIIVSSTGNGSFTLDPVSGRVEYTPDDCYFGLDSLVYVVSNTSGITSNEAIVLIRVEINPDIDSDGDGILDIDELLVDTGNLCDTDTDMDGIPNYLDPDDDGDDIPTAD
ncbi:MAG TPA: Ig-like domain-containing protein, partial [Prolixibacteraceae bacterium]|nr:Ig-like domain-containing protein [Prolixibacteraceae bacterium]